MNYSSWTCTGCGETKPVHEFAKDRHAVKGFTSRCRACHQSASRRYRKKNRTKVLGRSANISRERERSRAYYHANAEKLAEKRRLDRLARPKRFAAKDAIRDAVRYGRIIKPTNCEECGETIPKHKLHGHHEDYGNPLDVKWLCSVCHGRRHRGDS